MPSPATGKAALAETEDPRALLHSEIPRRCHSIHPATCLSPIRTITASAASRLTELFPPWLVLRASPSPAITVRQHPPAFDSPAASSLPRAASCSLPTPA